VSAHRIQISVRALMRCAADERRRSRRIDNCLARVLHPKDSTR
jgi:hypothetical protein